jgi:hypothetical protein
MYIYKYIYICISDLPIPLPLSLKPYLLTDSFVKLLHRHIWGYLRVVFTSMNKLDLVELSSQENTKLLGDELKIPLIDPL